MSDAAKPPNPEVEQAMRNIASAIETMPSGYGFALLVFSYGEERERYYLSSAQREDVVKLLQEFIARQKGWEHDRR